MNQKQIVAANKAEKTAIYFNCDKRISTVEGINYTEACIELKKLMHREGTTVAILLFDQGEIPEPECSWNRQDYEKYVKKYQTCGECMGFGLVNDDGFCKTCSYARKMRGEAQ